MDNFVLGQTRLTTLDFIPSIRLYLADEVIPVWEKSERDAPPFWAFAWAGGQALARHLIDNPDLVRGKRVLDLASGSGLVAIAAAQCGAAEVIANEIDEYAIAAVSLNAQANDVQVRAHLGDLLEEEVDVDVVLAGDIFYSREMTQRMLSFLDRFDGELVLVGDPGRAYAPTSGFDRIAEYDVPVNSDLEDTQVKRTVILRAIPGLVRNTTLP
ncbi:MAG TPA: nicotinamide N-methylase [Micromonosporaceae bacterium]|nr:nicotinamide N-methylase [Micromonosporaceae bacterium]